jgi:adenine-specific DNA-methyltransferase
LAQAAWERRAWGGIEASSKRRNFEYSAARAMLPNRSESVMPTLEFKGKPFVYSHHLSVPFRELVVDAKKSLPGGNKASLDDNLIIYGDNLEALKALLPRYAGKVDVIYIDPPYNTGNEGWVYNDNVNSLLMTEWLGKVVDRDDLERHDKWLCMMWPRLQLLKELLSERGTIWINLDDTEAHNAKVLCDEIFGERNFVTTVVWQKMDSPSRNEADRAFSNYHDFLLVYANDKDSASLSQQMRETILDAYPLEWKEGRRARRRQLRKNGKAARREDRPTLWYDV